MFKYVIQYLSYSHYALHSIPRTWSSCNWKFILWLTSPLPPRPHSSRVTIIPVCFCELGIFRSTYDCCHIVFVFLCLTFHIACPQVSSVLWQIIGCLSFSWLNNIPFVCVCVCMRVCVCIHTYTYVCVHAYAHHIFILLLVDGCWGCFHILAILNNAAKKPMGTDFFESWFHFFCI